RMPRTRARHGRPVKQASRHSAHHAHPGDAPWTPWRAASTMERGWRSFRGESSSGSGASRDRGHLMLPDSIRTARLLLRQPAMADAPALLAAYISDPEVARFMVWRPHADPAEVETFLRQCLADREAG